eukprot:scaffold340_cov256-Pinguiococcus_pyrenoidosus.AAC.9
MERVRQGLSRQEHKTNEYLPSSKTSVKSKRSFPLTCLLASSSPNLSTKNFWICAHHRLGKSERNDVDHHSRDVGEGWESPSASSSCSSDS